MVKEKSCLITTSLVGAVKWYLTAPGSVIKEEKGGDGLLTWKEKARFDLESTVCRVKTPFAKEASQGAEFEKTVYLNASKEKPSGTEKFQRVCGLLKGYEFYQKGGMNLEIAGNQCYLYCRYDAIKRSPEVSLKDLKTTASYAPGKYLNGFQHKMYCLVSGANEFDYVIVEWEEYPIIADVHIERYRVENRELLQNEVMTEIEDCLNTLKDLKLWEPYREKFCLY